MKTNDFISSCFNGNFDKVQDALEDGMNPDSIGSNGQTALSAAINGENLEIVECLITYMADVNIGDWTPLHELVDLAIDGMIQDNEDHLNPTLVKILNELIENGADITKQDSSGYSPIDALNTYAYNLEEFNKLKNLFRPSIPHIDQLIQFKSK